MYNFNLVWNPIPYLLVLKYLGILYFTGKMWFSPFLYEQEIHYIKHYL